MTDKGFKVWFEKKAGAACLKIIRMSTEEDVNEYMPSLDKLLEGRDNRYILVDLSDNPPGMLDKPARIAFAEYAKSLNFDKIAMYGANSILRMMAKMAVAALKMLDITKFFSSKEDAISWLKEDIK